MPASMLKFNMTLHAASGMAGLPVSFELAFAEMEQLPRMFIEPDGSFVWRGTSDDGQPWQVDGNLIDRGDVLDYVELKGTCPSERLDDVLRTLGWPRTPLCVSTAAAGRRAYGGGVSAASGDTGRGGIDGRPPTEIDQRRSDQRRPASRCQPHRGQVPLAVHVPAQPLEAVAPISQRHDEGIVQRVRRPCPARRCGWSSRPSRAPAPAPCSTERARLQSARRRWRGTGQRPGR